MAAVALVGGHVAVSGVSFAAGAHTPARSGRDSCVRVSLGRPGGAASTCSNGRRLGVRWELRAALKQLAVDNDEVAVPTGNPLQVHEGGKQNSGDGETLLSNFESLSGEKSREVAQEVALWSQNGISIYLIGMMASGKSTVGREVAKALKYKFYDSDVVIESYEGGKPCSEIFTLLGETEFRNLELVLGHAFPGSDGLKLLTSKSVAVLLSQTKALQALSEEKRLVVATGGGAVCKDDNWKYLNGVTVWLDVPLEDVVKRLLKDGAESRPILEGKCTISELSRLMEERRPHYAKAHCKVVLNSTVLVEALAESLELTDVGALTPTAIAVQVLEEVKRALQQGTYIIPPTGH